MATRGRYGSSGDTGPVPSVFGDFQPLSEWRQENASHILCIYLPGYTKEHIRISTEGRNMIRVRGALVAGNEWSRFLEDFQVPENGEMNSVRAKFRGGMLDIIVPKTISKPPKSIYAQKQPTPQKNQDKVTPLGSTKEKSSEPQNRVVKEKDIVTHVGTVPRITERREQNAAAERLYGVIKKMMDEKNKDSEVSKGLSEKIKTAKHKPGTASLKELNELNKDRQLLVKWE